MNTQDIINAWARIRKIDNIIPDDVLDFMKDCAIQSLSTSQQHPIDEEGVKKLAKEFKISNDGYCEVFSTWTPAQFRSFMEYTFTEGYKAASQSIPSVGSKIEVNELIEILSENRQMNKLLSDITGLPRHSKIEDYRKSVNEGWMKLAKVAPPYKWLEMYGHYQELLTAADTASWWQEQFIIADAERNQLKWMNDVKKEQENYPMFKGIELDDKALIDLFKKGKTPIEALNDLSTLC